MTALPSWGYTRSPRVAGCSSMPRPSKPRGSCASPVGLDPQAACIAYVANGGSPGGSSFSARSRACGSTALALSLLLSLQLSSWPSSSQVPLGRRGAACLPGTQGPL
eukprot:CAMPEP_0197909872 /NCGR_PEP_ID=MMETSP1439-20131203/69756_1 /TAXON_ID=66791 /ORGANISM="Gonyaulax spinifera, Strain CCMP409" /LENGTH=106 /DNA_ID=CAMNT_0043531477 /DNA_START=228 /DNA_END=549 /DNA_ORIENTATION=+